MSWEQRNADFCKAQTDAHMAYIEAEREADRLQAENDKLRELVRDLYPFASLHAARTWLAVRHDRMRELGIEVEP